jgi:hypothetical protein
MPDAAAYGAGLGADIGAVGAALQRRDQAQAAVKERVLDAENQIAVDADQEQLRRRHGEVALQFAQMQSRILTQTQTLRAQAAEGAAGHEEAVRGFVESESAAFIEGLDDERLRTAFLPDVARFTGTVATNEQQFAIVRRAERSTQDFSELMETSAANAYTMTLSGDFGSEQLAATEGLLERAVASMPIPEDARDELRRGFRRQVRTRAWQGAMERDPQAAIDALDQGALNGIVEADDIVALRRSAMSLKEHREAQARQAANAQQATGRAEARNLIEQVGQGVQVEQQTLQAALAAAQASGDPEDVGLVQDLQTAIARNAVTMRYPEGTPPAELIAARREIEGTRNWRTNVELVAAHDQLGTLIERTERLAREAPTELHIRAGGAGNLPPFNLYDPASVGRWIAAGDAAARRYNRPPQYIPTEVATQLKEQFERGGARDRANMILTFSAYGDRAPAMMRQIAPNEPHFAVLTDLARMRLREQGREYVREALNGAEQAAANGNLLGEQVRGQMLSIANRDYGGALSMMDGRARQGVMTVAQWLYASRMSRRGSTAFDDDVWKGAFQDALGRAGNTGGIGSWGGQRIVLPQGLTQQDFEVLMQRPAADIQRGAGGNVPFWGDRPMTGTELRQLVPVMVRDGVYAFRNRSGQYAASGRNRSQNFLLDIRAVARRPAGR